MKVLPKVLLGDKNSMMLGGYNMNTIQFICWMFVEFVIVFYHVVMLLQLLGPEAFLKNSPNELADKIMLIVCSCAFTSGLIGVCFFKLLTL